METVILLFLLASLDKDQALRNSLRSFLGFYKENRELLASLAQTARQPSAEAESAPEVQKKSRPEKVGSLDILDEYLKRCAV